MAAIALQIEERSEIAVLDPGRRGGGDDRLGAKGNAKPSGSEHGQIVGTVAEGQRVAAIELQLAREAFEARELGLAAEDGLAHAAGKFPVDDLERIGLLTIEFEPGGDALA